MRHFLQWVSHLTERLSCSLKYKVASPSSSQSSLSVCCCRISTTLSLSHTHAHTHTFNIHANTRAIEFGRVSSTHGGSLSLTHTHTHTHTQSHKQKYTLIWQLLLFWVSCRKNVEREKIQIQTFRCEKVNYLLTKTNSKKITLHRNIFIEFFLWQDSYHYMEGFWSDSINEYLF